jgi:predicted hotdog family 3-hydroxylacyl-ACP dehydratase
MTMTIENFIPHRSTMRLIDRLVEVDDEHAVVEAEVPHDGMFVHDGQMPAYLAIEQMAQSIAAWAGARAVAAGRPVPLGFLLGTRRMELQRDNLPSGTRLTMRVQCELLAANGLGMFDCEVHSAGELVARAKLSVFEPADAQAFLNGTMT